MSADRVVSQAKSAGQFIDRHVPLAQQRNYASSRGFQQVIRSETHGETSLEIPHATRDAVFSQISQ
jgi:hypothetical protein